ncbi:MAG: GSCFA domain-containing protein [Flavobacteriales bacterium]|nr:GSCFA domain-containing protein [Flavobacteriales bacterium]
MKLQSEVKIEMPISKIEYKDKLLFLGSCFSGNIGVKFKDRLFDTLVNPFGVIFNPISIFKLIERSIVSNYFTESDWVFRNDKWLNLDLHGELSFSNLEEALLISNSLLDEVSEFLEKADYLFLTFGTAWVYRFKENNQLVANCHKIPQKEFEKKLLTVDEIVLYGSEILNKLKSKNSKLQTVFTVSPVRHWADGAHNNNLSKSTLHLAVSQFLKENEHQYFPSYELVIDELRDYRFYGRDLVHPSDIATDYVWDKLLRNWISDNTQKDILEIEKVNSAAAHRPFNVESDAHQKFLNKILCNLDSLKIKHPYLCFKDIETKLKRNLLV